MERATREHAEWVAPARRIAPAVDGVEYYRQLRRALIEARRQVFIAGWDFHSEIDLLRGEEAEKAARDEDWPVRLADLLETLVARREDLVVRILIWEGSSLFALERQHLPRMKRPWAASPRLVLEWERDTPPLGSIHEKFVVIDDRVAFVGGMDLTTSRWDDNRHEPDDKRRRNPGLWPTYGVPYHELMLAVDGEAAHVLGDWARERWHRATAESVEAPGTVDGPDPWPAGLEPLLCDRDVCFHRTQPDHGGREEKRQVERAFVDQIAAARRLVYIETQYLAHDGVTDALCERLRDVDGPEVVLVLPYGCPGTLQSLAMDTRRDELLERLRDADPGGRLSVSWPTLGGDAGEDVHDLSVYVHAKALFVDDRLVRIGSSNLNNRSMGLDAELDASVLVDEDDADAVAAIAGLRRRLLGYLLHVEPERVAQAERERGSVVAAIEALRSGPCTLHPFDHRAGEILHAVPIPAELSDPLHPPSPQSAEEALEMLKANAALGEKARKGVNVAIGEARRNKGRLALLGLFAALLVAWQVTPLREWTDAETLRRGLEVVRESPVGMAGLLGLFVPLATFGFPVTVLVAGVGATLATPQAVVLCTFGVAFSSLGGFALGRAFPQGLDGRSHGRLHRIAARFADRGVLALAILRNVPVAPFAVVNVACGLTRLPWWKMLVGTVVGMFPGIVVLCAFGGEVGEWLANPTAAGLLKVLAVAGLVAGAALAADRLLSRWTDSREGRS